MPLRLPNPFAGDGVNAEERARCGVVVRVKRIGGAGEHHAARGGYGGNALSARCDGARYPKRFHLARRYALQTAVGKGNDDNAVGVRHAAGGSINGAEQLKRCGFLALGVQAVQHGGLCGPISIGGRRGEVDRIAQRKDF